MSKTCTLKAKNLQYNESTISTYQQCHQLTRVSLLLKRLLINIRTDKFVFHYVAATFKAYIDIFQVNSLNNVILN